MNRQLRTAETVLRGRPVLIAAPDAAHAGWLAFDLAMSLAMARDRRMPLHLVRPTQATPHDELFALESPEVEMLRPSAPVAAMLRWTLRRGELQRQVSERWSEMARQVRVELHHELGGYLAPGRLPTDCRDGVRTLRQRVRGVEQAVAAANVARPGYLRRTLLRRPVAVRLRAGAAATAAAAAAALGIDPQAPLVSIHARESDMVQSRDAGSGFLEKRRDDRLRNARIDTYFAACDQLIADGYTVIRLGRAGLTPVARRGMVDLTTVPGDSRLLQLSCLLRSACVITGESGLASLSYLTGTPRLVINATEPFMAYPLRAPGLVLPKRVVDRRTGLPLTPFEQLGEEYHRRFRDARRYQYIDNTAEEIAGAARELCEWMAGRWQPSPEQERYHGAIATAAADLRPLSPYLRSFGADDGWLGDGRIARTAVA